MTTVLPLFWPLLHKVALLQLQLTRQYLRSYVPGYVGMFILGCTSCWLAFYDYCAATFLAIAARSCTTPTPTPTRLTISAQFSRTCLISWQNGSSTPTKCHWSCKYVSHARDPECC